MKKRILFVLILVTLSVLIYGEVKPKNVFASMACPGLGQIMNGKQYGYVLLASELASISSVLYFNKEADLNETKAYEYAVNFAHIQPGDYPDQYFRNLSRYDSSGFGANGYNAMIRQQALTLYPNDPEQQQAYLDQNMYPDDMAWSWESIDRRFKFNDMRRSIQDAKDFAKISAGLVILNHVISTIDILRLRAGERKAKVNLTYRHGTPYINLSYKF